MISLPIGIFLTAIVFILSMGISNLSLYFNFHAFLIVGGGTIAILLFSSPKDVLQNLWRECRELLKPSYSFNDIRDDLIMLAKNRDASMTKNDELIQYAQDLWVQGTTQDLFVVLLSQKRKEIEQRSVDAIQCLKNLAKYPPSLGMAGTVMGIVTLFSALDTNKDKVGPGLAMAMTATFFGLVIANAVVMPLADRLQINHITKVNYLQNLYQVILLINQDEPSELIADEVRARAG